MFRNIRNFLSTHSLITVLVFGFIYCAVLFTFPDNFIFGLLFALVSAVALYWITRDFFVSLFIVFILSAFFLFPSKNYEFIYAYPSEYKYTLLPGGIFETIAITISDMFGFFLLLYFVKERIQPGSFIHMLNRPLVLSILISWYIYYAFSLFSSLNYSVFPMYSLDLLAQSGKMVLVFIGILYLFSQKKQYTKLFYITLLSILLFQSAVGVKQFAYNLSSPGVTQKDLSSDIEERTLFYRVEGITDHPNANAFAVALLGILTVPFVVKHKKKLAWVLLLPLFNIIFAQSRTVWFLLFIPFALFCIVRPKRIFPIVIRFVRNPRYMLFTLFLLSLATVIVVPRLTVTNIFFSQDGGGLLRVKMIEDGWQLLQQAPWIGFGLGMNVRAFINTLPNSYASTFPFPVHFALLQIALESGVPAALCFFLPFYFILKSWFGSNRKMRWDNAMGLNIIYGMIMIIGNYLVQPVNTRTEYFLIGIFMGLAVVNKYIYRKSV